MTEVVLGLDGGGTKTQAQAATADGQAVGDGTAGACNIAFMPLADAVASALAASDAALAQAGAGRKDVKAICAGVAGVSFVARKNEFLAALQATFPSAVVTVEPDYAVALTGATDGQPGIIVIAGTGSVAYGENAAGAGWKTGGYGYLIDDAGSGHGVGRAALAAVLRAYDGTGKPTTLTALIKSFLLLTSEAELVPGIYSGEIDRVKLAGLSKLVADAANVDGDEIARAILRRAGGALASLAHGVAVRLFAPSETFSVARVGSLWDAGPELADVFARSLHRFAPFARLIEPAAPPVAGAVMRAVEILNSP